MSLSTATLSVVLTSMINVLGKSKGRRVRGMPMACHTSSRSEDRRPGARSRERRPLRYPGNSATHPLFPPLEEPRDALEVERAVERARARSPTAGPRDSARRQCLSPTPQRSPLR